MGYTEVNARRVLARKLFEAQRRSIVRGTRWADMPEDQRREYERDIEKLFDLKDEETRDALLVLLHDGT